MCLAGEHFLGAVPRVGDRARCITREFFSSPWPKSVGVDWPDRPAKESYVGPIECAWCWQSGTLEQRGLVSQEDQQGRLAL